MLLDAPLAMVLPIPHPVFSQKVGITAKFVLSAFAVLTVIEAKQEAKSTAKAIVVSNFFFVCVCFAFHFSYEVT
jgi:hypothetical protein